MSKKMISSRGLFGISWIWIILAAGVAIFWKTLKTKFPEWLRKIKEYIEKI